MKSRKTKWVGHKFTEDQIAARKLIDSANGYWIKMCDALLTSPDSIPDKTAYLKRCEQFWGFVEKLRQDAKDRFPEVEES